MDQGSGTRGGHLPPLTLEQAQSLFRTWRKDEWGLTCIRIVRIAAVYEEYHGDYLAEELVTERNIIGAAVNALVKQGFLASTGEHRKGRSPASHGRRSYVYRLTWRGKQLARALPGGDAPPLPPEHEQKGLF